LHLLGRGLHILLDLTVRSLTPRAIDGVLHAVVARMPEANCIDEDIDLGRIDPSSFPRTVELNRVEGRDMFLAVVPEAINEQ
jgi:hypothetical protein